MTAKAELIAANSTLHLQMQEWRRDIHQHPETAYEELRTSNVVAERLQALGLEVHTQIGGTGVVGVLRGRHPGDKHIGLRADMDALPLTELNTFAHASRHPGKMHGCGHDGHTTMLLGAAAVLAHSPDFAGTIYFIFQPAEEMQAGAKRMIDDGLFERFPIAEVYGMHNWPGIPEGHFAVHPGAVMASTDGFDIEIHGQGGHAAMPDMLTDPVLVAGHIITATQSIIARNLKPTSSGVISITRMVGGSAYNVIPEHVSLHGTIRTLEESQRQLIKQRLQQLVEHTASAFGASASIRFNPGYPATINRQANAETCYQVASELVGEGCVQWNPPPSMGAEDFAYMLQQRPGAYIWIGNGAAGESHALHNPHYDFNDQILPLGANYWVQLAQRLCR
ncbi:M20 aminoacylase family protein [Candidatus Thiothrix sp. Deng01]|uniref:M20 aminoacylase family protein n=1 Tax=Candidatus Thiothrix phosphatis TaxID=3112415 RepID=A0ABU6CZK2_9GAMM|nr:M20 aminoacylase family protein [Candidatus Thiothrix sp. Deng01]MEB4592271.1 M20 aminoacylase family protein [Candidatus Thiothrix sp. Deng01]